MGYSNEFQKLISINIKIFLKNAGQHIFQSVKSFQKYWWWINIYYFNKVYLYISKATVSKTK